MRSSPRPDPELLLAHAGYVRALARELALDAHLALDVEQEVWLAVLQNAPSDPGALRGWLAALVRNLAVKSWRSSASRRARERASARPEGSVPSPAEILERENLRRQLVESVLALDEPYRSALILRFFEELPPRDVASRLGVPVESARTRIKRGLELLRERLDRGRERGAWCLALVRGLGVSSGPGALLRHFLGSLGSGVLLMSLAKKTAVAAAGIALVALGVYLRRDGDRGPFEPTPESSQTIPGERMSALEEPESVAERFPAPASAAPVTGAPEEDALAAEGSLLIRVRWFDGTPAEGVGALLYARSSEEEAREARTGAEGTCLFEHLPPGRFEAWLDRGMSGRVEVQAGARGELLLTIPRGNDVQGIVLEADGRPVAGADVYVENYGWRFAGFVVARSNGEGRFSIRSIAEAGCFLSARAAFRPPTPQAILGGGTGHTHQVKLVFPAAGGALEGIVRDGAGKALAGAQVQVGREDAHLFRLKLEDGSEAHPAAPERVHTGAEGRFRIAGLAAGPQSVRVRAAGHGPWKEEVEIVEGQRTRVEVTLLPGTSVGGTVRDPAGNPVGDVDIVLAEGEWFLARKRRSDANGAYLLEDLPAGRFKLHALLGEQVCAKADLRGAPGLHLVWDPVVDAGSTIRGRIVAEGVDLDRFVVFASHLDESLDGSVRDADGKPIPYYRDDSVGTDENGRFEFVRCPRVPHQISLRSSHQPMYLLAVVEDVLPDGEELVIAIDPSRLASVRLKGRVVDGRGEPLASSVSVVSEESGTALLWPTMPDGSFDLGPFPPGHWRILVFKKGTPVVLLRTDPVEVAAGETYDFGDLRVSGGD